MIATLKTILMSATVGFLLGLLVMFMLFKRGGTVGSIDGIYTGPTHTLAATVKAQDKGWLRKAGAIDKKTEQDTTKEVLQTGQVKGSDGKKTIAAVLDTKTGDTSLVVKRPFSEFMARQEVGIGYGLVDGDIAKAAQYRITFARVWNLYATVQVEAFQVDRLADRNPWNTMAFLSYRW
jgi:hypothetical protein